MTILSSIAQALFGCGLLGIACFAHPAAHTISVESYTSSSTPNEVTVVTTVNGSSTTQVIPAPYGVKTSVVETYNGTTPVTESSTTPLTQVDIQQMQKQEADAEKQMQAIQQQMDQIFADQQKMFQDMWSGFPQM
jgi:hypothetical protein